MSLLTSRRRGNDCLTAENAPELIVEIEEFLKMEMVDSTVAGVRDDARYVLFDEIVDGGIEAQSSSMCSQMRTWAAEYSALVYEVAEDLIRVQQEQRLPTDYLAQLTYLSEMLEIVESGKGFVTSLATETFMPHWEEDGSLGIPDERTNRILAATAMHHYQISFRQLLAADHDFDFQQHVTDNSFAFTFVHRQLSDTSEVPATADFHHPLWHGGMRSGEVTNAARKLVHNKGLRKNPRAEFPYPTDDRVKRQRMNYYWSQGDRARRSQWHTENILRNRSLLQSLGADDLLKYRHELFTVINMDKFGPMRFPGGLGDESRTVQDNFLMGAANPQTVLWAIHQAVTKSGLPKSRHTPESTEFYPPHWIDHSHVTDYLQRGFSPLSRYSARVTSPGNIADPSRYDKHIYVASQSDPGVLSHYHQSIVEAIRARDKKNELRFIPRRNILSPSQLVIGPRSSGSLVQIGSALQIRGGDLDEVDVTVTDIQLSSFDRLYGDESEAIARSVGLVSADVLHAGIQRGHFGHNLHDKVPVFIGIEPI